MRHATFGNENSFIFFTSFFPSTSWSEYAQIWLTRNTCQHIICIVFTSEQFGISKQYLQILQCNILLLCKLVIDVRFCWNPSMQKEAPNLWSSWKWKKKRKKRCSTYGYFFTWWKMASGKNVVCTIQWAVSTECTQNRTLHNCASSFSIMYHYFVFSLFWIYLRLFLLFTTVHYVTLPTLIFRSEWVSEWERSHVCALFHFTFGWCVRFFDLRRRDAIYRLNFLFSCKLLLRTFYSVNQCVVFFFRSFLPWVLLYEYINCTFGHPSSDVRTIFDFARTWTNQLVVNVKNADTKKSHESFKWSAWKTHKTWHETKSIIRT